MSVQVKGSGTIGGLDEGLVVSGIVTSSTQINVGSNIKLGNAGVVTATSFVGSGAQLTGITSPAITSIGSDGAARVLTSDGDGTATAHSFVTIESSRLSVNRGSGSGAFPLIVRRTDASGIIAEFANSSGYGLLIGQNSATGEAYLRTGTGQPLVFTTNSGSGIANERVRIDSAGRIGIGENSPTRDIVIKRSGSVQVSMVGATNQNVFLNFGDTDDDNIGGVYYDNTNNRMIIRANTNDAVQVKSDGNMAINDGDLQIGTSGHGIDFSSTSDASGMTSELLDDYEEGSFTPTYSNTGGVTPNYNYQEGYYTKIGNLVTCAGIIGCTNANSFGTGKRIQIQLPFTSASTSYGLAGGALCDGKGFQNVFSGNMGVGTQVGNSHNYGRLVTLASSPSNVYYTGTPGLQNDHYFRFRFIYHV